MQNLKSKINFLVCLEFVICLAVGLMISPGALGWDPCKDENYKHDPTYNCGETPKPKPTSTGGCPAGESPYHVDGGEIQCYPDAAANEPNQAGGEHDEGRELANRAEDQRKESEKNKKTDSKANAKEEKYSSSCHAKQITAAGVCNGSQFSQMGTSLYGQYEQGKANGDMKTACEAVKKVTNLQLWVNSTFMGGCKTAQIMCTRACDSEARDPRLKYDTAKLEKIQGYRSQCASYDMQVMQAGQQLMASFAANRDAVVACKAIENNAKLAGGGDCTLATAIDNPLCPAVYCTKPGRQLDAACKSAAASGALDCTNPAFSAMPFCQNPYGGGGSPNRYGGGSNNYGGGRIGSNGGGQFYGKHGDIDDDIDPPPPPKEFQNTSKGLADVPNQNGGGGGGMGGGAGSPLGGGSPQAGGGNGGNKDPEVFAGNAGAAAGIDSYSANDVNGDGSGRGDGGGGAGFKPFDINKYLPGKARTPANIKDATMLMNAGISEANGLSNWEKVTRKINEKNMRAELRK